MPKARFFTLVVLMFAAVASRLLPHLPNFTPIGAIALFGGAYFSNKYLAFFMPLFVMYLSDLILMNTIYVGFDFYSVVTLTVYGCFMLTTGLGLWLSRRRTALPIAQATLLSALLFFIITNFSVWATGGGYGFPKTLSGLADTYVVAIPFLRNMLLGNLFYSVVLFGGFTLLEYRFPRLREAKATA